MHKTLFCLAALLAMPVLSQVKAPAPQATVSPDPIPLTQIVLRSQELSQRLADISRRLPPDSELAAADDNVREQEDFVPNKLRESASAIAGDATLTEIRAQSREWRAYALRQARQQQALSAWGTVCDQSLISLNKDRVLWDVTAKSVGDLPELSSVLARIQSVLADVQAVKTETEQRLRIVLDLQARASKQTLAVADVVNKLNASRHRFQARLFDPDAPPLWRVSPLPSAESAGTVLNRSIARSYRAVTDFVSLRKGSVTGLLLSFMILGAIIHRLGVAITASASSEDAVKQFYCILRRPVSLAVLITSPIAVLLTPRVQMNAVLALTLLFLLPITRLLPFYTPAARLVYFLVGFYASNGLVGLLELEPAVRRLILSGLFAGAICSLAWWGRPARFRRAVRTDRNSRSEVLFVRWLLVFLLPVLITNIFGFLPLSHLLRLSILVSSCFGLVLYTFVRVAMTAFMALLQVRRVRTLASVRLHEAGLVMWTERILKLSAGFYWIVVVLNLLEADQAAGRMIASLLNARPGIRAFDFSVGDLLAFSGVLLFGYLIASGVRFVLREEILPHWRLPRGVPETVSSSSYYVLLLLVFFMSLNAAGIQLDKLTMLTGAFGVGLGFGMQNIVNNFVSGLILQYERPIRVGDVLEVGNLSGEIRRIGIRASTMRTFQGAEVIIPNSAFVSEQVINWTLSESRRRVEIPVGVAYGTDPERVIQTLLEIAGTHAEVLREPAHTAVFQGFGESSLNFLLMFWADQNVHFRLRSEICVRIDVAFRQAGIDIALPQREIRVHSVPSTPTFTQSA